MSGGLSNSIPFGGKTFFLTTLASTNITKIKNSFGRIFNITITVANVTDFGYLKLFNIATAPNLGVTPAQIVLPLGSAFFPNDIVSFDFAHGCLFNTGIYIATTTESDDIGLLPLTVAGIGKIVITYL